ncbi:MAG: hypothetical protein COV74_01310 [Candidatus Omnitrophica bacterium CG11_big_fil_rev_8_21_14_0_20_45_26]|uniref:DUF4138 domain-containing protein n=1 Tax=Candidatus Abzuiibacterium crystallinum TaxID=1974748 RepID=A0A2H0LS19_9BACT|nr:MAG: hypothetical protein COV74_01310 [Candidatus Omnitrophica bacterium CG11_big_fil_rev_8_21_14_0_20_45_26]PIW64808.1 MAG: hypothetical protein COW12_04720 [Candidatus Omnitrophica bacterium CG12_big_fil_rev_8_21_14_0_65_45_16]
MKQRKMAAFLMAVLVLFITFSGNAFPEEKASETENQALLARRKFNQLKKSTPNIYKLTMRSNLVFRLQTALGFVSTIDLPEKALKVFVGDQDLFKVEVYEKQILIKPVTDEAEAATNLTVFTESGRLAFHVTVGLPETADFVLDFRMLEDDKLLVKNAFEERIQEKQKEIEAAYKEKEDRLDEEAKKLSQEKLIEQIASDVNAVSLKASETAGDIQVNLLSLTQIGGKAYLRFSVLNYSKAAYAPMKVLVGTQREERKFLKTTREGIVEFPSEVHLPEIIQPDSYVYGVCVFDYRPLGEKEKPIFKMIENVPEREGEALSSRTIEISGFRWFE